MAEPNDIKIRKFVKTDLDTVKNLIHHTIDVSYAEIYPPNAVRYFKKFHSDPWILKGAREGYMIIAEKEGQIIGTGTIKGNYVLRVFVDPKIHRQSYGKRIMSMLEQKAKTDGLTEIIMDVSLPSKIFYERLGYHIIEEASIDVSDGQNLDYYKAKKSLNKE